MPRRTARQQEARGEVPYWVRVDVKGDAELLRTLLPATGVKVAFCYPEGSASVLIVVGDGPACKASTTAFRRSMMAADRLLREHADCWRYAAASAQAQAVAEEMRRLQWAEACREPEEPRKAPDVDWQERLAESVLNFLLGDDEEDA